MCPITHVVEYGNKPVKNALLRRYLSTPSGDHWMITLQEDDKHKYLPKPCYNDLQQIADSWGNQMCDVNNTQLTCFSFHIFTASIFYFKMPHSSVDLMQVTFSKLHYCWPVPTRVTFNLNSIYCNMCWTTVETAGWAKTGKGRQCYIFQSCLTQHPLFVCKLNAVILER